MTTETKTKTVIRHFDSQMASWVWSVCTVEADYTSHPCPTRSGGWCQGLTASDLIRAIEDLDVSDAERARLVADARRILADVDAKDPNAVATADVHLLTD